MIESQKFKVAMDLIHCNLVSQGLSTTSSSRSLWGKLVFQALEAEIPGEFITDYLSDKGFTVAAAKKQVERVSDFYENHKLNQQKSKSDKKKKVPVQVLAKEYLISKYIFLLNPTNKELWRRNKIDGELTLFILGSQLYNSLYQELRTNNIPLPYQDLEYLLVSDFAEVYYPFRHYLENLKPWDPSSHSELTRVIDAIESPDTGELKTLYLTRWLLAMVNSNLDCDDVNHQMLVFVGPQGKGKSTWINNILPPHIRRYKYTGSIDPESKDTLANLPDSNLMEWDELSSMSKKSSEAIKSLLTMKYVRFRRPYERIMTTSKRIASFIGSTNDENFLQDLTGDRRFLCLRTNGFKEIEIDHEQLYSELMYKLKNGEQWFFSEKDGSQQIVDEQNKNFRAVALEEELLLENFKPCTIEERNQEGVLRYKIVELINQINGSGDNKLQVDNFILKRMGAILRRNKFESVSIRGTKHYLMRPILFEDSVSAKENLFDI